MFFFGPALMLEGSAVEIAAAVTSGVIGVFFVAASVVGYGRCDMQPFFRAISFAAGVMLLLQGWLTDIAGVVLAASVIVFAKSGRALNESH